MSAKVMLFLKIHVILYKKHSFLYKYLLISEILIKFVLNNNKFARMENLNRIKAVLAETHHTNKWLAEQMGRDTATVSKWCTNTSQPDLRTLSKIAELLGVDQRELLVCTKSK
jgi:DNA-binding XRE family transcriptional regulator